MCDEYFIGDIMIQNNNESLQLYFKDIKEIDVLDVESQKTLVKKAQQGDEKARDELVTANLRFVVVIAKQYKNSDITLNELISEGNLGLVVAIDKFDSTQNISFISYAAWWIRHYIVRTIHQSAHLVRLPINKRRLITKMMQEQQYLISMENISVDKALHKVGEDYSMSSSDVDKLVNTAKNSFSLDQEVNKEEGNVLTFLDGLTDRNAVSIETQIEESEISKMLENYLTKLPVREAKIICKRFGLRGEKTKSLSALSKKYSITKERIRQIEKKGILRMKKMLEQSEYYLNRNTHTTRTPLKQAV